MTDMNRIGMCTSCLEMTSLDDPCCPMAGVFINGNAVFPDFSSEEIADSHIKAESIRLLQRESRDYSFAVEWIARMQTPPLTEAMLVKLTADLYTCSAIDVSDDVKKYRGTMHRTEGSFLGEYLNRKD